MPEGFSYALTTISVKFIRVWKCVMRFLAVIVTVIALACGVPPILVAQMANPWSPGYPPPPQAAGSGATKPVAKTVNVTVPIFTPPPTRCPAPPIMQCPQLQGPPCWTPPVSKPRPVKVGISVRPDLCDRLDLAPVVYRDPGFFKPMISSAVCLVGATVAAPFRLLETLIPVDVRPNCGPPVPPPGCLPPAPPPPVIGRCGPPPCVGPPVCAPGGPSVAPLPQKAVPQGCGPVIPPMLVARDEEPPCAPQSLLGGILKFPSRLLCRGRFVGDMGATPTAGPPYPH